MTQEVFVCPNCGGEIKYYDHVKRMYKEKYGQKKYLYLARYRCKGCHAIHRILPDNLLPYKHYSADVIFGVVNGFITNTTIGFEDYPCDWTMKNWKKDTHILQLL